MFAQRKALENSEKSLSEFIPYSAVIAPGVVICREGDLVATVKISGKVFEAVSNEALQRDAERQNNFLKVMASASSTDEMSLKVHRIRRVVHDQLSVPDENLSSRFVRDFVRAYNSEISENNLMATELYVSLVSHKATALKRDKYKESEIREELKERLEVFGKVFDQLVSSELRARSAWRIFGRARNYFFSSALLLQLPADRAMAESQSAFHAAKRSTGERSGFRRSRYP